MLGGLLKFRANDSMTCAKILSMSSPGLMQEVEDVWFEGIKRAQKKKQAPLLDFYWTAVEIIDRVRPYTAERISQIRQRQESGLLEVIKKELAGTQFNFKNFLREIHQID